MARCSQETVPPQKHTYPYNLLQFPAQMSLVAIPTTWIPFHTSYSGKLSSNEENKHGSLHNTILWPLTMISKLIDYILMLALHNQLQMDLIWVN